MENTEYEDVKFHYNNNEISNLKKLKLQLHHKIYNIIFQ